MLLSSQLAYATSTGCISLSTGFTQDAVRQPTNATTAVNPSTTRLPRLASMRTVLSSLDKHQ